MLPINLHLFFYPLTNINDPLQERIAKYSAGEIHFNLMAVVSDQRLCLQRRLDALSAEAEPDAAQIYELTQVRRALQR